MEGLYASSTGELWILLRKEKAKTCPAHTIRNDLCGRLTSSTLRPLFFNNLWIPDECPVFCIYQRIWWCTHTSLYVEIFCFLFRTSDSSRSFSWVSFDISGHRRWGSHHFCGKPVIAGLASLSLQCLLETGLTGGKSRTPKSNLAGAVHISNSWLAYTIRKFMRI